LVTHHLLPEVAVYQLQAVVGLPGYQGVGESDVLQDSSQGGFLGRWMSAPVLRVGAELGRRDSAEFLYPVSHHHSAILSRENQVCCDAFHIIHFKVESLGHRLLHLQQESPVHWYVEALGPEKLH